MSDETPSKVPPNSSWGSFTTIGDERQEHQRKDTLLGWICLVLLLSAVMVTLVPLLGVIVLSVATGGRLLVVNPTARIIPGKIPIFGDRQSVLFFIFALGVWWLTHVLAQPVRVEYGAKVAWFACLAMACVANAPVVWFMKRRLDQREQAEQAERVAIQEARRRQTATGVNEGDAER